MDPADDLRIKVSYAYLLHMRGASSIAPQVRIHTTQGMLTVHMPIEQKRWLGVERRNRPLVNFVEGLQGLTRASAMCAWFYAHARTHGAFSARRTPTTTNHELARSHRVARQGGAGEAGVGVMELHWRCRLRFGMPPYWGADLPQSPYSHAGIFFACRLTNESPPLYSSWCCPSPQSCCN